MIKNVFEWFRCDFRISKLLKSILHLREKIIKEWDKDVREREKVLTLRGIHILGWEKGRKGEIDKNLNFKVRKKIR